MNADDIYQALAAFTTVSLLGLGLMMAFMNPSHRRSFFGRLSLRQYIDELFEERTYAPFGHGLDASRAHLLKFSRYYWPSSEKLGEWLVPSWDGWVAADPPPVWLTAKFKRLVEVVVPPEAQPLAVLKDQAEKRRKATGQAGAEADGASRRSLEASTSSSIQDFLSSLLLTCGYSTVGGDADEAEWAELVAREKKWRAGRAFDRARQVWIWSAALAFSYVDLISTVSVGFQYLAIGDEGRNAAYVTFAMLAGSLAVQAACTQLTGEVLTLWFS